MPNNWKDRDTSPDRTVVWTEPVKNRRKVPVVYYLSCNGQLQHPHFIEVPLSSPDGLYLRDVINRLNFLRGKSMASMYSWSCKRSYRNGYVWHDLAEDDFIYPSHGHEYVLKGSELLEAALVSKDQMVSCPTTKKSIPEMDNYGGEVDFPMIRRRRHQSFDLNEYQVYKTNSTGEPLGRAAVAADASTQTDDKLRRRRAVRLVEEEEEQQQRQGEEEKGKETQEITRTAELSKYEISPPPSDSSPETLETLMKADGRIILLSETVNEDHTAKNHTMTGKSKSSSSLFMQLLKCGSTSFNDCGPGFGKEHEFSVISHYKARLPRGRGSNQVEKGAETAIVGSSNKAKMVIVEDKEYFSGSLIETKKNEFPSLKRSSSYNADRLR